MSENTPYFEPAAPADIKYVAEIALQIWEHPIVQKNILPRNVPQVVSTSYQPFGSTDLSLVFTAPSAMYPKIQVFTEETLFETLPLHDLVLMTAHTFTAKSQLFSPLPTYRAVSEGCLCIEDIDDTDLPEYDVEFPMPSIYSGFSPKQFRMIRRGRKPENQPTTLYQIERLAYLLKEFNPATLANIRVEATDKAS